MTSVNSLPTPTRLRMRSPPPSSWAISLEMDSPSPVPPNFRLVEPSAWLKASKMWDCFSSGMPMPVSTTVKATLAEGASWRSAANSGAGRLTRRVTLPFSVNLTALDNRLRSICCSRWGSVWRKAGASSSTSTFMARPRSAAMGLKSRSWLPTTSSRLMSSM